jgi:hypothetical protein
MAVLFLLSPISITNPDKAYAPIAVFSLIA